MKRRFKWMLHIVLIAASLFGQILFASETGALAAAGPRAPQAPNATVNGTVTLGSAGEPGVIITASTRTGTLIGSTTTDAQGNYSLNVGSAGSFFVTARKGVFGFTPSIALRFIFIGQSSITQNFSMIRPPIVIVGGYTPFTLPQSSCPQRRLDGSTYQPGACGETEFDNLLTSLRGAGWNVRTVMLNTSLLGSPRLSQQTSAIRRSINDAQAATGAEKVIVFAHSTGGPAVRRYIESSSYAGDVSHFFTFGSQHMGNPVEDIADVWFNELMPDYLRENTIIPNFLISTMMAIIDTVISNKVEFLCSTSLFQFTIPFIGTFNVPGPGQVILCETSISGMANFNLSFRPNPDIEYHLIHGRFVRSSDLSALGQVMTSAIPGSDDTLIQTNSTTGFVINGPHDRLLTRDPHMTMTSQGERWYLNTNGAFDSAFVMCIRPMFILRTISESNCGTVSRAPNMDVLASSAEEEAAALAEIGLAAGEPSGQKTSLRTASLPDSAAIFTDTVELVDNGPATFVTSWVTGTVDLTVLDPDGNPLTPGGNVQVVNDDTHATLMISSTVPGKYTLQIQATDVPTNGLEVSYHAAMDSQYTLTTGRTRNWLAPGSEVTVTAFFTGTTEIQDPVVMAYIQRQTITETQMVTFTALGGGNYSYVYTAPDDPGYIEMEIIATGKVSGVEIERSDDVSFTIYPDSFKAGEAYSENVSALGLTLNAGIDVTPGVGGDLRVTAILVDSEGQQVGVATTVTSVVTGTTTLSVPLFFNGAALAQTGVDGPFTVSRLLVVDERVNALVSDDQANVFTTSAIDVSMFTNHLFLPMMAKP